MSQTMILTVLLATCGRSTRASPPNIVMFLSDDQGYHDMVFNNPNVTAPHIKALAAKGRVFRRHYVFKYCSPTRGSLLSGRLPYHAHQWNLDAGRAGGINRNFTLLPAKLKACCGYKTHLVGKFHGGMSHPSYLPTARGFDTSYGLLSGGHDHITQENPGQGCVPTVDLWDSRTCGPFQCPVRNGTYEPYLLNEAALAVVEAHDPADPLYLHFTPHMVHSPYELSPTFPDQFPSGVCGCSQRCTIQSMSNAIDSMIGNLTAALAAKGMDKNFVFIYSGDNGGVGSGTNWPFKGTKMNFFEGGIRGGGFFYSTMLPPAVMGQDLTGIIHICDWWMTLCRLAGGGSSCDDTASNTHPLDSLDMWPLISGANDTSPRDGLPLVIGYQADYKFAPTGSDTGTGALIWGDYKLIAGPQQNAIRTFQDSPCTGAHKEDDCSHDGFCLYNLATDPGEQVNLFNSTAPSDVAARKKLQEYYEAIGDECRGHTDLESCNASPCTWDHVSNVCRVYNLPDASSDDTRACVAIAQRHGYWGPWLAPNCTDWNCTDSHGEGPGPSPPPPPAPAPTPDCNFTANLDYYPAHTAGTGHNLTPEACCALCKQAGPSTCVVASIAGGKCYLKPPGATPRPKPGTISCKPTQTLP